MDKESKNGEDRLGGLPDDILCHILSFLDTKYAVATSVLSTRWKNLYNEVPNIVFDDSLKGIRRKYSKCELYHFARFAFRQIMSRNVLYIDRFCLHSDFNLRNALIRNLLCAATSRNVKELDICTKTLLHVEVILPDEVFTSQSLVVLKLRGFLELDVPQFVRLPNLKVLHLKFVRLANRDCIRRLYEGCKLLEELLLIGCSMFERGDVVDLSIPSLRKLAIKANYNVSKFIIDTPKLEFYEYEGSDIEIQLVDELKCVDNAKISFIMDGMKDQGNLYKLINKMHGVKSLYLLQAMPSTCYSLPVLEHLTRLKLCGFDLQALSSILESTPQLQELVISAPLVTFSMHSYGSVAKAKDSSSLRKNAPICLVRHLKNVVFKDFLVCECGFELVKYFLQNGEVLEMIKFETLGSLRTQALSATLDIISMFPKSSEKCEIVFVSK